MKTNVNLEDLKIAYSAKNNQELKFTYFIFCILQFPRLLKLLTACATGIINYRLPLQFFIKKTIFKLFCSGETLDDAFRVIKKLDNYKVLSVLDYVSEGEKNQVAYTKNTDIITSNIVRLGKESPGNFVSVKISGLEDPAFLEKINGREIPVELSDKMRFEKLVERIDHICSTAAKSNVVIFIDAEDRCMQDVLDKITEQMMETYNKKYAVVFNTLQMYLNDRLEYLNFLVKEAKEKKYISGVKLVRGAYVEKERAAAAAKNKPSPVFDTKAETDASFDAAVEVCLKNHSVIDTCVASHNAKSILWAIECIEKHQVPDAYHKVRFSQLYGMSDNLSFNLAAAGYNTSKYLPYGEIKKAIPYLIRRAEENSSISGQMVGELTRLKNEIYRRKEAIK